MWRKITQHVPLFLEPPNHFSILGDFPHSIGPLLSTILHPFDGKSFYLSPSFSFSHQGLSMCRASEKRDMSLECYTQKHTHGCVT